MTSLLTDRVMHTFSQFTLGTSIPDMQVGCLWQGDYILTVSLSGDINYLDRNNPSTPSRVVKVMYLWYMYLLYGLDPASL